MGDIASIHGYRAPMREPNERCIKALEDVLERAKSGEIVGVGIVCLYHDNFGSYHIAGTVGGYSMLGAATVLANKLAAIVEGEA